MIRVDEMENEEVLRLLLHNTARVDTVDRESKWFLDAQKIVTELDCMPLAPTLATQTFLFQDYLDIFVEPMHQDTATSVNNLAGLCNCQGKYDEAGMLFKRALATARWCWVPCTRIW